MTITEAASGQVGGAQVRLIQHGLDDGAGAHPEPRSTEDTACVGLIGAAERAATAEPEALEAWADDEAGRELHVASQRDRLGS